MTIKLFRDLLSLAFVFAICSISVCGQVKPPPSSDAMTPEKSAPSKSIFENQPIEEMHVRRTIRLAEKHHLEHIDRAREAAKLSASIRQAFFSHKVLDGPDRKKLEKVEKLTRRVRSEAGGSDTEAPLEQVPRDLEEALSRLADLSEQMSKMVEKTPRQVVSTAVIESTNRVLEIIEYTRRFIH